MYKSDSAMHVPNTLYIVDRKVWREWLESNFDKEKEIWLVYPNKSSGKPKILYNDAVEEALCFGWIDSIAKKYDVESAIQKFSPRNPKSSYSQSNKERLKWLYENGMIHPSVMEIAERIVKENFIFPSDIIEYVKDNAQAWKNYKGFSESYRRIRIAYINEARKRPEEFNKRLKNFISKTRENKLIKGFGGIEKYY